MTPPPRHPRRHSLVTALLAAFLLAAPLPALARTHRVNIDDVKFKPAELKVRKGDTVVWTNNDDRAHTVTADDRKSFSSGNLNSGSSFDHTFNKPGRYKYHCDYHPRMKATVVVED